MLMIRLLESELVDLEKSAPGDCSAAPVNDGTFFLDIAFPNHYPFKSPKIKFSTRIYHCNVNEKGNICLNILGGDWSTSLSISKVLQAICCLLTDPIPDNSLRPDGAKVYKENRKEYGRAVEEWTNKCAQ
eukprot:jgi/Bigna1/57952/fgenesh1_pm.41_\